MYSTLPFKNVQACKIVHQSMLTKHLFDQKYSKNSNVVKYYSYKIAVFILKAKLNFIAGIISVTQHFRNHSNMLIWYKRNISY